MPHTKITTLAPGSGAALAGGPADDLSSDEHAFVTWARNSLVPLSKVQPGPPWDDFESLGRMIGDARIVALSEAVHCGAEPLEFRNRLFQYLVTELGFTAIAIESGITEGRRVYDYVRGKPGDLGEVLAQGIGWTFDQLPQNAALIEWMRHYNANAADKRKINFYGFDVPGSPANSEANRGPDTALTEALQYLHQVDPAAGAAFQARFAPLFGKIRFEVQRVTHGAAGYESLEEPARDALTAGIADLLTLLERREAKYTAASSREEYEWAHRAALGARQVDTWLRHIPLGWEPRQEPGEPEASHVGFFSAATDARDRGQADNLEWIVRQEGAAGKILVYAARYHLSASAVKSMFWLSGGIEHEQQVAGTYLRRRFGARLVTIGNVMGAEHTGVHQKFFVPKQQSIDGLAREIGVPLFLLDLRTAPPRVAHWLRREHALVDGSQELRVVLDQAFDVLFYVDIITQASDEATVM